MSENIVFTRIISKCSYWFYWNSKRNWRCNV